MHHNCTGMSEENGTAKTPEEVAEITGGDVTEIAAAYDSVRIIRDEADTDE